jgi:hypothetical protein
MASRTVADHVLSRLREWGADTVFGYAGDGINGSLAAWDRADNQPRFVQRVMRRWPRSRRWGMQSSRPARGVCRDVRAGGDPSAQRLVRRQAKFGCPDRPVIVFAVTGLCR